MEEQKTEKTGDEEIRVKLDDIHIVPSQFSGQVYAGVIAPDGSDLSPKVDRSKEFAIAAIHWIGAGNSRLVSHQGKVYKIAVTEHEGVEEVESKLKR